MNERTYNSGGCSSYQSWSRSATVDPSLSHLLLRSFWLSVAIAIDRQTDRQLQPASSEVSAVYLYGFFCRLCKLVACRRLETLRRPAGSPGRKIRSSSASCQTTTFKLCVLLDSQNSLVYIVSIDHDDRDHGGVFVVVLVVANLVLCAAETALRRSDLSASSATFLQQIHACARWSLSRSRLSSAAT